MANTYHQLYIHGIFAVKYREAVIQKEWKHELFGVIGNLINETECKTILVNGVEDHVHCFFGLIPRLSISDVMQIAKGKSSKWVNENGLLNHRFEWQVGYGCFSYNHSQIDTLFKYIQNQEEHHKKVTFKDEYERILKEFGVSYDEKYLFEDLI